MLKEHSEMARKVRVTTHRSWEISEDVVNLFKAEVDKLTVIDDGAIELLKVRCQYPIGEEGYIGRTGVGRRATFYSINNKKLYKLLPEAQLQHTKKELLDLMGE